MKSRVNLNPNSGVYQAMLALETYVRNSSGLEPIKQRRSARPDVEIVDHSKLTAFPSGPGGSGTRFEIAGSERRQAKTAFKSPSFKLDDACHGIGGKMGRPTPMCFPARIAWMNISSVQMPRPVSLSGVK